MVDLVALRIRRRRYRDTNNQPPHEKNPGIELRGFPPTPPPSRPPLLDWLLYLESEGSKLSYPFMRANLAM